MTKKIIKKLTEMGVQKKDVEVAIQLGKKVEKIESFIFRSKKSNIRYSKSSISGKGLTFNSQKDSYEVAALDLKKQIECVQFPLYEEGLNCQPLNKGEKIIGITAYEIRRRFQSEGLRMFRPWMDLSKNGMTVQKIIDTISFFKKEPLYKYMFEWEKKEFDAEFIASIAIYCFRKNMSISEISEAVRLYPIKWRH